MGINFVFICAIGIVLVNIITGAARGFLKSSLSLVALLVAGIVVSALNPFVTGLLRRNTGLDEWISEKVGSAIEARLESAVADRLGEGAVREEGGNVTLEQDVTLPMDVTLPDGTVLPAGTRIPAGTTIPSEFFGGEQVKRQMDTGLSGAEQDKVIDMLPLPQGLKDTIAENNNSAVYEQLGVEHFTDYIGGFVGNVCLNIVGYLLTFMIVFFALHLVMMALNVVDRLPLIHGINHFAGAILGIFKGFLVLEILFLLLIPFSTTDFGAGVLAQINANGFLRALYHGNILMKLLVG
ncbi:MAG: CvpA family protein [Lachnospiraceae bacterium]|jgi:uncharacterized membrane protein required for colicin V production|nr:CvpA family protein [Lachnospiraceae bacterium]